MGSFDELIHIYARKTRRTSRATLNIFLSEHIPFCREMLDLNNELSERIKIYTRKTGRHQEAHQPALIFLPVVPR